MAGTREGNLKGAATKRQKYGTDHFSKIGAAGGAKSKGRQIPPEVRQKISQTKRQRSLSRESLQ